MNNAINITKKKHKISLRLVLIIPFLIEVCIIVGLVGFLSYQNGKEAVNDIASQLREEVTLKVHDYIEKELSALVMILKFNTDAVKRGELSFDSKKQTAKMYQYLAQLMKHYEQVSWISLSSEKENAYFGIRRKPDNGELRFVISNATTNHFTFEYRINDEDKPAEIVEKINTYFDPHQRSWYSETIKANKMMWLPIAVAPDYNNMYFLDICLPIHDKQGKLLGITGATYQLDIVQNFLSKLTIGKSGQSFIFDKQGLLIASSQHEHSLDIGQDVKQITRPSIDKSSNPIIQATAVYLKQHFISFDKIDRSYQLEFDYQQQKQLLQISPYQDELGLDWFIVTIVPESDFLEHIYENTQQTFLISMAALILVLFIGILTARSVTKPILRMNKAAKAIAQGHMEQTLAIGSTYELAELAVSFNSMAHELQDSFETLEHKVAQRTAELAIAKDKAEVANQAKSAFIANMSHELRSPLNAIIGFSQIMLRTKSLPKEQYENAGIIHRSGDYLLTLINNVLDFSKIEAGKTTLNKKDFDLFQLLDDLEDTLHLRAYNAGLELIFVKDNNLPRYLYADGVKLRQVLLNLLGNAIKFTQQGEVVLSISAIEKDNQNYELNFSIRDTGVGIAPDELNKLFEAFSQTNSGRDAQEGTGLGLVISQQFVRLMGGDISVTSELGKGTCFDFEIKAQIGKEIHNNNSLNERQIIGLAPNQPTYKILIVDDKAINRQLLCKLLSPFGFDLQEASNGQEAIAIWEQWQPHLIWMDMRMPVMDGYEATKYIKSHVRGNATAVIALTASVLEEEKAIVLSAGCDDFVRKPFRESIIFEMLTKHLGVQFIYENITADSLNSSEPVLSSQHFQVMPVAWLKKLFETALEADSEHVLLLIAEIPETEAFLAKNLTKLARQFQFEKILDFIEPIISDNS